MKKAASALAAAMTFFAAGVGWTETRIVGPGTTGLAAGAQTGYLGEQDRSDSVMILSDEFSTRVLFFWDNPRLELRVRVFLPPDGRMIAEYDLSKGNLIELPDTGKMELHIESAKGTGHWACLLLSGKEWDIR